MRIKARLWGSSRREIEKRAKRDQSEFSTLRKKVTFSSELFHGRNEGEARKQFLGEFSGEAVRRRKRKAGS